MFIGIVITGCGGTAQSRENIDDDDMISEEQDENEKTDNVIVWGVPEEYLEESGIRDTLEYFNNALSEDGYDYVLEFTGIDEEDYYTSANRLLDNNNIDILSLGFDDEYAFTGTAAEFIESGKLYDLTDYLKSDDGEELYSAINEELWDGISYNQHIYAIPNQCGRNGNAYVALKKEKFGDSITEIDNFYDFLKQLEGDENYRPILWDSSFSYLCPSMGYEYYNGILVDIETGECYFPGDVECITELLNLMNDMYISGEIIDASTLTDIKDTIIGKDYSVLISSDWTYLRDEISDDYNFIQLPYTVQSRISGSVGVNAGSSKTYEALNILSKLYSDEKYANALIYGEENYTYKIEDGLVYDMGGEPYYLLYKAMFLGVYDNLLPSYYDDFIYDRKETKNSLIGTAAERESPTRGFFVDDSEISDEVSLYLEKEQNIENVWKLSDFDIKLEETVDEIRNSNLLTVVETVEEQLKNN
jgi:hypothetical protein